MTESREHNESPTPQGPKDAPSRSSALLRRIVRDALVLAGIIVTISVVQMFHYRGKPVAASVLSAPHATLDGRVQSIIDPTRPTLVYVFAPWCGVCKSSARNVHDLDPNVAAIAVALSYENNTDIAQFVAESGLEVPVILGDGPLEDAMDVGQYPTYLLLDKTGKILTGWSGYTTRWSLWLRVKAHPILKLI